MRAPRVKRALACAAVLAVCAVFPLFVNGAVGYVPLGCAVFALALSWVYLRLCARSLRFEQDGAARTCVRGEDVELSVAVCNASPLVVFHVKHTFVIEDGEGGPADTVCSHAALAPRERRPLRMGAAFDHVGVYGVGLQSAEVFDLFGAFGKVLPVQGRCRVRVAPRVHPVGGMGGSELTTTEAVRSVRSVLSDDMDYAQVRAYQLGDPMKTVHWKLSARGADGDGQLFTKLFESHTNPGTTVLLDFYSTEPDAEARACLYDALLEAAWSLVSCARDAGVQVDLVFRDRVGAVRTVRGGAPGELDLLLDDMPRLGPSMGEAAAARMLADAARDPDAQANFVFATSELTDESVEALLALGRTRRSVRVVCAVPAAQDAEARRRSTRPMARLADALVPCACVADGADIAKAVAQWA